jgi:hypothetical protein
MNSFKLLNGIHFQDGKKYKEGDVVESPHDLVALFPQKFEKVAAPVSEKTPAGWDDEDDRGEEGAGSKHRTAPKAQPGSRTMRDK